MTPRGLQCAGTCLFTLSLLGCGGATRGDRDGGHAGGGPSVVDPVGFSGAGTAGLSGAGTAGLSSAGTAGSAPGCGFEPGAADPGDVQLPWPSAGCGLALPPEQLPTVAGRRSGYTEWHVNETGATLGADVPANAGQRQFFVRVPADYDPCKPYRVVYVLQGCGERRAGSTAAYGLFSADRGGTEQAVYVALSVPDNDANPGCYDNNKGAESQEWEAFDLIHAFVERTYCVDNHRVYVGGFSSGSWVANMWGCYFGGTPSPPLDQADLAAGRTERRFSPRVAVRGHAGISGRLPANQPLACNGPSAGLWVHDTLDNSNLIDGSIAALNLALQSNGCTGSYADGPKQPWAPGDTISGLGRACQVYTGCPAEVQRDYPLVFCTTTGTTAHTSAEGVAIPAFKTFFDLMDPAP
jgi:hypothetical protein